MTASAPKIFHEILDYSEEKVKIASYYQIVQTNVIGHYLWYKKCKPKAWFYFRATGVLTILFSVVIPVLSAYEFKFKAHSIVILSLLIAIFSGMNSFYRFGEKWQSFVRSEMAILYLVGIWKLEVVKAVECSDRKTCFEILDEATNKLLVEVGKIVSDETEEYFSKVNWPKSE